MREQTPSTAKGRMVGRYVVHDRLAAGGMATVHLGRLLGAAGFSRTVAIKRLHDAYAKDPDFVAMLLDEARIAAMIRHPNVVATLDVVAEDDELLVVMEYVEGESVGHLVKLTAEAASRVPIAFAASIAAQTLHGLHAAHEARDKNGESLHIVHRDVSPQNILVGTDGVARVLDFGIAKAASRATATEDGQIKGKTAYMAPEQLLHAAVDRRTDMFAASVVLWELLCGRRLFVGNSPAETMARVLSGCIDPPEMHTPNLPPALAHITMRGLARDPAQRFSSAEEMALAIEEAVPMARAKDLGAWVAMTARSTLEARSQLVHAVEQSSHKMPSAQRRDSTLARVIDEADRRRHHAEMSTEIGASGSHGVALSASSTALVLPPANRAEHPREDATQLASVQTNEHPRPRTSRLTLVLALGGGLVLGLGVAIAVLLSHGAVGGRAADTSGIDAAPPTIASAQPARSSTVAPPASVADSNTAALPRASTKPPVTVRPISRPPSRRCDIPFEIDAKGQKHFRPECVVEP